MKRKIIAGVLAAVLCLSPAVAAGFPDITDPQVSEAAEVLRQLEVVNGKPGGLFDPAGTFTRAEFCKMALTVLGRADEVQFYVGRVIFSDVTATHWALGYINASAAVREGVTPLVRGKGDGRFCPDDPITCGEAVTILMRCLGYTDKDVGGDGGAWYNGAMLRAGSIGLLDGLKSLDGSQVLTRAQAALLFEDLLNTQPKDSTAVFLETVLGGKVDDSQLVLEVKGKALAAGGWAVKTDKGSYVTFRDTLDPALQGRMCKPVTDKNGNVLALQADPDYSTRTLRILSAEARYAVTDGEAQVMIPGATPIWKADGSQSTYAQAYKEIGYGANAVFCFDKTDTISSIYLTADSPTAVTAVAGAGARPFDGAWAGQPTAVYKNGVSVALADVKPYDVGVYDPLTGVLELFDRKLTGIFEDAAPSPVSPNTVTVMGCAFPVLECALKDLTAFRLGDRMTLLLDGQNRVAGVVPASKLSASVLGVATIGKGEPDPWGDDTYEAKVALAWGPALKGQIRKVSAQTMDFAQGKLYAVTSTRSGFLDLSTPNSDAVSGDWNVAAGRIGSTVVSPAAAVYDKTPDGPLTRVDLAAVTAAQVPARQIAFLRVNNAGHADVVVLDDATGDGYTYGRVSFQHGQSTSEMYESTPATTTVSNGKDSLVLATSSTYVTLKNTFMGMAPSLVTVSNLPKLGASVKLTAIEGIPRSAFGDTTVAAGGKIYPLASNIDQCCFNPASETWFQSLDEALAYSSTLTVYFDKEPELGGKVRLVAVQ